jgi:hypothetical protein
MTAVAFLGLPMAALRGRGPGVSSVRVRTGIGR